MGKSQFRKPALLALLLFPAIGFTQSSALYAKIVKGTVTSATDGEPLIGASIRVEGTQKMAVTDIDGNFSLDADDGQTISVSYIGFIEQKIKVSGDNFVIKLKEEANSLNDAFVGNGFPLWWANMAPWCAHRPSTAQASPLATSITLRA